MSERLKRNTVGPKVAMESKTEQQISNRPPFYKEVLVALLVGGLLGPLVGWFIGTFATFFAVATVDTSRNAVAGMRTSAFVGGLIGIPLGLLFGLAVSLPLRLMSARAMRLLRNPWAATLAGCLLGWCCGYLLLVSWSHSSGSVVYIVIHSTVVGGVVGGVTVIAKPKWL